MHVHTGKPRDLFNQLAKKLVTRAAALLTRTPGVRRLQQNRLPLGSTRGQSGIPGVAISLSSGRHRRVRLLISILSRTFLEHTVKPTASAVAGRVREPRIAAPVFSFSEKRRFLRWGRLASGELPLDHTSTHMDNSNFSIMIVVISISRNMYHLFPTTMQEYSTTNHT